MGERVKKYNLGAVIEQDNPNELLEQAWNMIRINHAGSTRFFFGIQRYLEQHSWQNFDAQIRCMLDSANQ
jgi:hypothetical protein